MMHVRQRLELVKKIYSIHDEYASVDQAACTKGCSACCTCNVTATTMEGLLIYEYLMDRGQIDRLARMIAVAPALRFRPKVTINEMVALCVEGKDIPEENNDPSAGICSMLDEHFCSIYPVRPFGCRAMLSTSECVLEGEAQMSPFNLSVNNVIMQYIEAVDQPGGTGNLFDVLAALSMDAFRERYLGGRALGSSQALLVNRSFPVLMVPPEHRSSIAPLIQSLDGVIQTVQSVR